MSRVITSLIPNLVTMSIAYKIMYDTLNQRPDRADQQRSSSSVADKNSETGDLPALNLDMPGQYQFDSPVPESIHENDEYSDDMETDMDRLTAQLDGTDLDSDGDVDVDDVDWMELKTGHKTLLTSHLPKYMKLHPRPNTLKLLTKMAFPGLSNGREELDREETLIRDNTRGISIENPAGKVQQRVRLDISKANGTLDFQFTLEQPTKSKSCRFSRFLGSRRLLECHFSMKDAREHKQAIIEFFVKKKLLINGRLFQAFYGHQGKVNLMEVNQDFLRKPLSELGDDNRLSLPDFIAWHNNLHLNANQTINKWVSRFALGFSTSQPGLVFRPENINFMDDIYAVGKDKASAASHEIMTDGCGFLNYAALKAIQENMAWDSFSTCVQARIGGAKGLFMLHPEHRDPSEEPKIWMRSSQVKIQLNPQKEKWSPIHFILDVLSGSLVPEASSITYEMIMSLSENKVPDEVLVKLLRDTIEREARSMEPSSKPHGAQVLYDSIYATHRVLQGRLRRVISPDAHRAQALVELENDDDDEGSGLAKWEAGPDPFSGQPASSQEQVLGWLQSGFAPTDRFVMEKLVYLQKKLMTAAVNKYRIAVPESVRAFIVPDPLGVLGEGEVFFASSQPVKTSRSGLTHCITGPVL
ncbi:hypothetical protein FRC11_000575, partial [Ceratobasidium sp. 423]